MKVRRNIKTDRQGMGVWLRRAVLLLVFGFAVLSVARGVSRLGSSGQKIDEARSELADVKKEQEKLKSELQYVNSDYYKQKEARDKLGLAKPGEIVVVLPSDDVLRRLSPRKLSSDVSEPPEPNWHKWAKLFFDI